MARANEKLPSPINKIRSCSSNVGLRSYTFCLLVLASCCSRRSCFAFWILRFSTFLRVLLSDCTSFFFLGGPMVMMILQEEESHTPPSIKKFMQKASSSATKMNNMNESNLSPLHRSGCTNNACLKELTTTTAAILDKKPTETEGLFARERLQIVNAVVSVYPEKESLQLSGTHTHWSFGRNRGASKYHQFIVNKFFIKINTSLTKEACTRSKVISIAWIDYVSWRLV